MCIELIIIVATIAANIIIFVSLLLLHRFSPNLSGPHLNCYLLPSEYSSHLAINRMRGWVAEDILVS